MSPHIEFSPKGTLGYDMEASFDKDLARGSEAERLLARILGLRLYLEVKRDSQAWSTGNFFVEVSGNMGQPSGISTTVADVWAIAIEERDGTMASFILVPTWRLKRLIKGKALTVGCEGSKGVLVRVGELTGARIR